MACISLFKKTDKQLTSLVESLRKAFHTVKEELDEHLESINDTTSEVQELQGVISELDAKIDKLSERVDEIELTTNPKRAKALNIRLSPREQELFMALYLGKSFSLSQLSRRLGFTEDMVNMYIMNVMTKGVPIRRELIDGVLHFGLEPDFKDLQARRNILQIDPKIARQASSQGM